jgi:hypothetical protein
MSLVVDHIFIACTANAPQAEALLQLGFIEGSRDTHPGQGTANRRFFFENFMLELLWVRDETEATSALTHRTRLWERCSRHDKQISPFGIVMRPGSSVNAIVPYPTWSYFPIYLPTGLSIDVAEGTTLAEPELFYLPFLRNKKEGTPEPTNHALPLRRVKSIAVGLPNTHALTNASKAIVDSKILTYFESTEHVLTITFEGPGNTDVDLRPHLPLILRHEG